MNLFDMDKLSEINLSGDEGKDDGNKIALVSH